MHSKKGNSVLQDSCHLSLDTEVFLYDKQWKRLLNLNLQGGWGAVPPQELGDMPNQSKMGREGPVSEKS